MSAITSLVLLLLTIGFVVFTTTRWKLHPFFALLLGACGHGLAAGLSPDQTLEAVGNGLGRTVAGIGIVIASGCVIGAVLERTGAALAMANAVLRFVGRTRTVLAMGLTGGIVSVPVFCDSGFVILAPLARSLALRAKQSMAAMAKASSQVHRRVERLCGVLPMPCDVPVGPAREELLVVTYSDVAARVYPAGDPAGARSKWWLGRDSNSRPRGYECRALTS